VLTWFVVNESRAEGKRLAVLLAAPSMGGWTTSDSNFEQLSNLRQTTNVKAADWWTGHFSFSFGKKSFLAKLVGLGLFTVGEVTMMTG